MVKLRSYSKRLMALAHLFVCLTLVNAPVAHGEDQGEEEAVLCANNYIRDRVGEEVFSQDFVLVGREAKFWNDLPNPRYNLTFQYAPKNSPWVDVEFKIIVATDGSCDALSSRPIPDCASQPELCDVEIIKAEAIEIAEQHGLPIGIREWKVELRTKEDYDGFVWVVTSFISEKRYQASSRVLVIDGYIGDVLADESWMSIQ